MIFEEIVKIKVIPRAKKTEIIGTMDDGTLKIRIKAVPENWKANDELIGFLKKITGADWEILSGATATRKLLRRK